MIPLLILSPLILLAALGAVWLARPVHAALLLALTLSIVAVLYLVLGAHFIGLGQFAVYVGAVAILIVFSLLITRPGDEAEEIARRPRSLIPGLVCTLPVLAVLTYVASRSAGMESNPAAPEVPIDRLGTILFTTHAPAVMAVGVLLTAVLIGAALFAREPEKNPNSVRLMTPLALLLTLSSVLFTLGLFAVLTRRNAILVLVGIELMLNAANINFIAFWRYGAPDPELTGPMFVLFSIAIAAAEAAVGLAIILMVFRHTRSTDLNRLDSLHG